MRHVSPGATAPQCPVRRPFITAKKWAWLEDGGKRTPGIGLMRGGTVTAHLTPAEAIALADQLVDMAETMHAKTPDQEAAA